MTRSRSRVDLTMNQVEPIASIQSIYRYPVKSMAGEVMERCDLTEAGVLGDRLYAFESSRRPFGHASPHQPRAPGNAPLPAHAYPDGRVEVRVPTGEQLLVDSPDMLAYLSAHLPDGNDLRPPHAPTPQTDVRPLSLISKQTVRQLSIEAG